MLRGHLEAPNLLGSVLSRLQRATLERPRPVLIGGLLLTVLAVWLGVGSSIAPPVASLPRPGTPTSSAGKNCCRTTRPERP